MSLDPQRLQSIPWFQQAGPALIDDLARQGGIKQIPAAQQLAFEGAESEWFFVLLSGRLRVYKLSETGREVTLYHVQQHESCVLTIFSILSQTRFPAFAVSETELELLMVPARIFKAWVDQHPLWREHVFQALSCRLHDILQTLDRVTFQRVDARVAEYLIRFSDPEQQRVLITHEKLARELGTSRVVVSRILEGFERDGIVRLARGQIQVLSRIGLQQKLEEV